MRRLGYALILFALSASAWALDFPPVPSHYVTDTAGILSAATRQNLEAKLQAFEDQTSNQILVATFPDLQGETVEEFAVRLYEKWKPGQKGRDNGAILVVSKNDRKLRIEVGYGLEGALPDSVAETIIQREVVPAFKSGDFDRGIDAGVDAIIQATKGEYKGEAKDGGNWRFWIFILIIFLFIFLPVYTKTKEAGTIVDYNWENYTGSNLVWRHPTMEKEEIEEAYLKFRQRFYTWSSIFKRFWPNRRHPLYYFGMNFTHWWRAYKNKNAKPLPSVAPALPSLLS